MSFFFTKKKATPAVTNKPPSAAKSSKEILNRLGCKVCPLVAADNCTPKMAPIIAELAPTDIYILGDQVSEKADKAGIPFAKDITKLLCSILGGSGGIAYDNVIRDFDPVKTSPQWVAMEACRGLVTRSIERAKPKLLLGLGILPLQWVLNSSDMIGLRGRVFAVQIGTHACWFLPTYHPDYVIENSFNKKDPLKSKFGHCLKFDIAKALSLAASLPVPIIEASQAARQGVQRFNGHGANQLPQLLALISEARKAPEKAIDIETTHLRPYAHGAKILTVALSYGDINFSFALHHPKAGWSLKDREIIKQQLMELLSDQTTIIAHNAPFEVEWLLTELGREAIFHDVWHCTMMQAHVLDERRGKRGGNDEQFQPNPYQALDFLIKQYFGLAYKGLFKLDRKNMAQADLDETLLYNGADTKYTLRLFHLQVALLKAANLYDAYLLVKARQPTVALMQSMGIEVDQTQNKVMQTKLGDEIERLENKIKAYGEVQSFIRDRKSINIASTADILKLLKDYIKAGSVVNSDGKESVDKGVLEKLNHPIGKDIEEFRNRSKLKSTYVDPFEYGKGEFIWPDGKIHPAFNTTFAETFRLSSDEPNQQNWPSRKDKWVRKQIIATKNHVLVAFDYGQLEACTAAICTQDKVLIKALWEDYDIHMEWTHKAVEIYPEFIDRFGGDFKKARGVIKNKLVFPVIFGATNKSVAGYLNAPQDKIDKLMAEFWKTFSGIYSWQQRVMDTYYEVGYVESPTGKRRRYPLTKNQAVNHPIQSVACDIVCDAMVTLSEMAADTGKWYLHPIWNIHDDLGFSIPDSPDLLEEAIETIYRVMLTPKYDFVNVPMSVSGSIGTNWLDMDEGTIGKFWSHKDL